MSDLRVTTVEDTLDGGSVSDVRILSFDGTPAGTGGGGGGGAVDSVNGETGVVVLSAADVGAQPADSDLTAIAALTTTVFGRGLLALVDAAALRTAAGLGTAATQASTAFDPAGAATAAQAASQPLDSDLTAIAALATTAYGRSLLTAADAAAARALTGAGTSSLALGTTSSTAKAGDYQPAAANISDASVIGRSVLTATDAAAVRAAIGAGTSSLALGTTGTTAAAGNDGRLSDARTPTAHAASHAAAGSDPLTLAESQVTGLVTDLAGKAASVHTHAESDVTGLVADLAAKLAKASNLSDLANAGTARTNLGLGTAATVDTGTASGNVPLLSTGGRLPIARIASGTPTGSLFVRDDGTLAAPAGGGGSSVKDPRWNVLSGQTSIDEFNDSSLNAAWVRVDGTGAASGNLTWTEDGDVLSAYNIGGDTTDKMHALLRPLTGAGGSLAAGDAFITYCKLWAATSTNHAFTGLVLSSSATFGSGEQVWGEVGSNSSGISLQTFGWTGFGTSGTSAGGLPLGMPLFQGVYVRLVMTAANTWRTDYSVDGISWIKGKATLAKTVTPTHVGFFDSSYGTATEHIASYEFLRRVAGVS